MRGRSAVAVPSTAVALVERLEQDGGERVVWGRDAATGLRCIVAVHSTVLGPGLGGTRFRSYADGDAALTDVLRLARGMTYKMAAADLPLGGGKAVIIGDPALLRTDELILAYGRVVDELGGRYLTAEDVGTTQADMDLLATVTPYVTGTTAGSGDPSPATAAGVMHALAAVAERLWGDDDLGGRHVVVSGVGKVGHALAVHLLEAGAKVTVADVDGARAASLGTEVVDPDAAHTVPCDVFAPCALGAVLNARTIPELRCAAVCGSANNQLAEPEDARRLAEAGVLYAPDYVVNAGGVINIAEELDEYDRERAWSKLAAIRRTTAQVFAEADAAGITTAEAADRLAERRLAAAR